MTEGTKEFNGTNGNDQIQTIDGVLYVNGKNVGKIDNNGKVKIFTAGGADTINIERAGGETLILGGDDADKITFKGTKSTATATLVAGTRITGHKEHDTNRDVFRNTGLGIVGVVPNGNDLVVAAAKGEGVTNINSALGVAEGETTKVKVIGDTNIYDEVGNANVTIEPADFSSKQRHNEFELGTGEDKVTFNGVLPHNADFGTLTFKVKYDAAGEYIQATTKGTKNGLEKVVDKTDFRISEEGSVSVNLDGKRYSVSPKDIELGIAFIERKIEAPAANK